MTKDEFVEYARKFATSYFLAIDAPKIGKHDFPQLERTNYLPELPVLPFNYLTSSADKEPCWYHCFVDDDQFERLHLHFGRYEELLRRAKGIISADFSLYRDYDEWELVENCRRNRSVDYALQRMGVPMIPTAGFAGESSWEWCFDGLPLNSTVAITTNCLRNEPEANRLFVGGVNAMVNKIHPTAIVVCGKCPDWIAKRFPNIQIVQIPNYSQMWHERSRS